MTRALSRELAEAVLGDVVAACDPARRVREALAAPELAAALADRPRRAIAVGKAALAMARGAGEVVDGLAVVPAGGAGELPAGWRLVEATHPVPDERSAAAGAGLLALVQRAGPGDAVLALLSGGASALAELPRGELAALVATVRQVMAAGAPIDEINAVRGALSQIKAGRLALASAAPVVTLAVSDVIGDPLAVIGSGPTVGPWLAAPGSAVDDGLVDTWRRARAVLARLGIAAPAVLDAPPPARQVARRDRAAVITPMASAARAAIAALAARGIAAQLIAAPIAGDVAEVAQQIAGRLDSGAGPLVLWGEPTVRVPPGHGAGGRAQQLALLLAGVLRGTRRGALVVGTDGIDGPPPPDRRSPAGAWVDGATRDAVAAAGVDPDAALAACDAGTALAAASALVVIGPTGINHADLVLIG
jgi:hydroxypyruvate reductase